MTNSYHATFSLPRAASQRELDEAARKEVAEMGIEPPYDLRFEAKIRMDGQVMGWTVTVDKDSATDEALAKLVARRHYQGE